MDPGGRTLGGRYRLGRVIGRGGMSTVYEATDSVLGRTVAVKVLLTGLADQDSAYVARFEREARAAAALHNRSVVAIYDVGVDGEERFIVMERVSGESLATLLRGRKPLPIEEVLRVGADVAGALGAAHAVGIVHRDIKPANVMVTDDGTVKVLDFGVARMLDGTTITQAAAVLGTAAYMAPERALGEPGDARADIYSLGCLLYAMLTGAPPFEAELAAALLHQHINSTPQPVGNRRAEAPAELDALVMEMLAKAPDDRPQSAKQVAERLAAIDAHAGPAVRVARTIPLVPSPPPNRTAATTPIDPTAPTRAIRRPMTRSRRRREAALGILATAAIALIVLLASSGGGSSQPHRAAGTVTKTVTTHATTPTVPSTTNAATTAPQTTPPAPVQPAGGPPGHAGGPPPGHAKHPGHGHGGGD